MDVNLLKLYQIKSTEENEVKWEFQESTYNVPVPVHVGKGCKPTKRDYINLYKLHMNRLISCKKELFGFFI